MRNNDNNHRSGNRGSQDREARSGSATRNASGNGDMSVRQAGHMGGQRERELVQQGKQAEGSGRSRNSNDR